MSETTENKDQLEEAVENGETKQTFKEEATFSNQKN